MWGQGNISSGGKTSKWLVISYKTIKGVGSAAPNLYNVDPCLNMYVCVNVVVMC